mmetsp:Transcript_9393/g.28231  ORF Transcript_9393/g.28231 Transcript_9393/m.28231 type:complete len:321 (-) Transcript_9393:1411-2373(-)
MVRSQHPLHRIALLLGLGLALGTVASGYTAPGANEKAVRSDIPYIRCGVCEALAKNAHRQIKTLRDEHTGPGRLSEIEILEKVEKMTDPVAKEGEWITKIDLAEKGSQLTLEEHQQPGECGSECKTVAKAAQQVLGDLDTDLGELLWKGESGRLAITNWLCKEATDACTKKAPPLPGSRKPGPAFKEIDEQELNMQRMMKSMEGSGMKGSVYSRDEAMKMASGGMSSMGGGGGGGDEDDDEDDDEDEEDDEDEGPATRSAAGVLGSVAEVAKGVLDQAGLLVEKAMPALATAGRKAASIFSSLAAKLKPPVQTRPPHVEL